MWYEMQEGVTSQRADGQGHQVLYQLVVEDFLHHRYQGNADQANKTDDGDRQ